MRLGPGHFAIFLSFIGSLSPLELAAQDVAPRRPRDGWAERFLDGDKIPVSGSLRVGIMVDGETGRLDPRRFHVLVPAGRQGPLCVEISSRDGRYEARKLSYDMSGLRPGLNRLLLPTQYAPALAEYSAEELAILAWLAPGCDADRAEYVIAAWEPVANADTLSVYLNSAVPTFVVARAAGGQRIGEAPCRELSGPSRAFNRRCEVPLKWARDGSLTLLKRERRGSRSVYVNTPLPILAPGRR